jgi:hypothetical protein
MNSWLSDVSSTNGYREGSLALMILLLLILSFFGWGNALARTANVRCDRAHPLTRCLAVLLGQALVCWLFGWLGYFHQYTGLYAAAIVSLGACFAFPMLLDYVRKPVNKRAQSGFHWLAPLAGAALVVLCIYLPPSLNLNDDSTAYSVFPLKISHMGGLGADPFSERRLFSLGAHYPLQALVLSFLSLRYLSITEPALGVALTLLLLGILSAGAGRSFSWKIAAGSVLLLAGCVAGSTVLANLAPAFLMVPPVLLLICAAMQAPELERWPRLFVYSGALGALAAYLTALRPTATPFAGLLVILAIWKQSTLGKEFLAGRVVKAFAAAALGAVLFALPFALDLHGSSGTYLYPLLGRGFHASASGHAPTVPGVVPLANHLKNFIHAPLTDWLLLLAVAGFLVSIRSRNMEREIRGRFALVFLGMLLTYGVIVYQTGGVDAHRYAAPMILAFLVYMIADVFPGKLPTWLESLSRRRRPSFATTSASVCLPLAVITLAGYHEHSKLLQWLHAKIAVREQALSPSEAELADYKRLQEATPAGTTILATLQRNNLLDFHRNQVLINDQPGMIAPPPGWPFGRNGKYFSEYLRNHGVQYVAVMREAVEAPPSIVIPQGWAGITGRAGDRFYADLADLPFRNSIAYESGRLRLYRVSK